MAFKHCYLYLLILGCLNILNQELHFNRITKQRTLHENLIFVFCLNGRYGQKKNGPWFTACRYVIDSFLPYYCCRPLVRYLLKNILFQMQISLVTWSLICSFLYSFITFIWFIFLTKTFRYKTSSEIFKCVMF